MTRPLTPGAYLKARRTAAGLSVADVAERLATEPRSAAHARVETLELIEADIQPATFSTIVALGGVYRFDISILGRLELIAQGWNITAPRLCRICACSEQDPCILADGPCGWRSPSLCTACAPQPHSDAIAPMAPIAGVA